MRYLVLANNDAGLYKFRKDLIEELLRQNHDIYVSLPNGRYIRSLEDMGCIFIDTPIDRRGINPKKDFDLFFLYRKMLKEINPDYIITYTIKPNIYGGIAARLAKKSYAVNITGLGTAFENSGFIKNLVVNLYKVSLKKAKVVFFENSNDRDVMVAYRCCDSEKTVVLNGAGVNTNIYDYQPYPLNDRFKFLFIGRVMKEKGIDELFEAISRLINDGKHCFLDVVGPFEEDYKEKLLAFEAEGWVKYHGYQEDVKSFIRNCDCFVLPSYHEGMANTNLECASSGRPIVTSNIPGCKEAVVEGSGILCEPRDVLSLYEALKKIMEMSREEREEMGKNGRKYMIESFDKKKVVTKTLEELEKM